MYIKLSEIKAMTPGLNVILGMELPAKPSYWLARWLDRSSSEMKAVQKARVNLIKKYSKKDKDGKIIYKIDPKTKKPTNQVDFTEKNFEKFNNEFNELLETEVKIDFKPIKLADLDSEVCEVCGQKKLRIKPIVLYQLGKIIVE